MEFTLLWAALTGGAAAWAGTRVWARDMPKDAFDLLLSSALVGLLAGRLAAMVVQGINPLANPVDVILVRGGVHTGAAATAALAALGWRARHDLLTLDAVAAPALLGLAGWHAGCLWRGSCLGTVSSLPWSWAQPGSELTRHPVALYTAALLVAGAIVVASLRRRPLLRSGVALAAAGLARLLTEPMRLGIGGGPEAWYAAAAVAGLLAAWNGPRLAGNGAGKET